VVFRGDLCNKTVSILLETSSHFVPSHYIDLEQPRLVEGNGNEVKLYDEESNKSAYHMDMTTHPFVNHHVDLALQFREFSRWIQSDEPIGPGAVFQIIPPPLLHRRLRPSGEPASVPGNCT
jgi:hypothetical protein